MRAGTLVSVLVASFLVTLPTVAAEEAEDTCSEGLEWKPSADLSFGRPEGIPDDAEPSETSVPGCPADPYGDGFYSTEGVVEQELTGGLVQRTYAEHRLLNGDPVAAPGFEDEAPDWLDYYAKALACSGYEVVARHEVGGSLPRDARKLVAFLKQLGFPIDPPESDEPIGWHLIMENRRPTPDAPTLGERPLWQRVAVGFSEETQCFYRRYCELSVDGDDAWGVITGLRRIDEHPEWKELYRTFERKAVQRKFGRGLVVGIQRAERVFAAYSDQFLRADLDPGSELPQLFDLSADPMLAADESEELREALEGIVADLARSYGVPRQNVSAGICDPSTNEYALVNGDTMRYGACVPKLIIILAAFEEEAAGRLTIDNNVRGTLARMIRLSAMPEAGAMGRRIGIDRILEVAQSPEYRLYDRELGGGLWTGRFYHGHTGNVRRDPVGGLSHGVTARQGLRYYWMLDHGKLVSPDASKRIQAIFLDRRVKIIKHKFVAGLWGRGLTMVRKSGTYSPHHNDTAMVTGPDRHYIMVCFVKSGSGSAYLQSFARKVDDYFAKRGAGMAVTQLGSAAPQGSDPE